MTNKYYPNVQSNVNFPEVEEGILKYWQEHNIFQQSVDNRPSAGGEFIFYDGPPFANGLPHYGHLLTGFIKDVYARYQTSNGKRVERRFGWDCHGLPAEMQAEKEQFEKNQFKILNKIHYGKIAVDLFNSRWRKHQ